MLKISDQLFFRPELLLVCFSMAASAEESFSYNEIAQRYTETQLAAEAVLIMMEVAHVELLEDEPPQP